MQIKSGRRANRDRSEEMRQRLVAAARALFVADGFMDTATPAIVTAAGVTRGAMYHHFADKKALFAAVVEAEAAMLARMIEHPDHCTSRGLDRLLAGVRAQVAAMAVPDRARLLLLDGPAVLGPERMAEIKARHGDEALRTGLAQAIEDGELADVPLDALHQILSAAFERAALAVARGADKAAMETAVRALLDGLRRGG